MLYKMSVSNIVFCAILLASASQGYAEDAPQHHLSQWPIWHWHNHQPRQDQLNALHKSDVTPEESREIDQLYMQLEQGNPKIRYIVTKGLVRRALIHRPDRVLAELGTGASRASMPHLRIPGAAIP